ncbi:MAG: exodeoxyribonuclease VII small subunit [Pedosphaera sp.]|nr:exodeoxyribonuclease VII small subunit [Pedosphaera sp.]
MSKAAKGAGPNSVAGTELPFEEALKKLESIVESMEADDLPLETLLQRFEEGTNLAQMCQTKLGEAELKIQRLEKTASGEIALKPLSLPENASQLQPD